MTIQRVSELLRDLTFGVEEGHDFLSGEVAYLRVTGRFSPPEGFHPAYELRANGDLITRSMPVPLHDPYVFDDLMLLRGFAGLLQQEVNLRAQRPMKRRDQKATS